MIGVPAASIFKFLCQKAFKRETHFGICMTHFFTDYHICVIFQDNSATKDEKQDYSL